MLATKRKRAGKGAAQSVGDDAEGGPEEEDDQEEQDMQNEATEPVEFRDIINQR